MLAEGEGADTSGRACGLGRQGGEGKVAVAGGGALPTGEQLGGGDGHEGPSAEGKKKQGRSRGGKKGAHQREALQKLAWQRQDD